MNRFMAIAAGILAVGAAREVSAECRLIVNIDLTSSMQALRDDGQTKCFVAQNSALLVLEAYKAGKDFDITQPMLGFIDSADYDANCPSMADRLLQVWTFQGTTLAPLWSGFVTADVGYELMVSSGLIVNPLNLLPTDVCPGSSTPMAQSMCRVAWSLAAVGPAPAGVSRVVKTLTDGGENSSTSVPLSAGEPDCRDADDSEVDWRNKIKLEYLQRDIKADTVLFEVGGSTDSMMAKLVKEGKISVEYGTAPLQKGDVPPLTAGAIRTANDVTFFSELATITGGLSRHVLHNAVLAPAITLIDTDNDGVPNFRDACVGACANDSDGDQIPSPTDQCSTSPEDARGANKTDGCPDTDSDGFRNGLDICPTIAEDGRPPFLTDGCRAANFNTSASPNVAIPNNSTVCTSLNMTTRSDSRLAKLNISGSYTSRQSLSATLAHNGKTVVAFPAGTLPTGSGNYALTNRVVATGLTGDTLGTWTLCVTDSSTAVTSGTIGTWSVHN
jgi:hypothetical protein